MGSSFLKPDIRTQKAIFHYRKRKVSMVFLFVLLIPLGISFFWSAPELTLEPVLEKSSDSRIQISLPSGASSLILPLEEYLYGCLPTVIPAEYEMECLKAQVILLRTYFWGAYLEAQESGRILGQELPEEPLYIRVSPDSWLTTSQLHQLWGSNYGEYAQKVREAVDSTRGWYLAWNAEPILACYFAVSNGRTRDGELLGLPYLKSVSCPEDYLAENYLTQITIRTQELTRLLGGSITDYEKDSAGYCLEITASEKGAWSGERVRQLMNLPSAAFAMEENGKNTMITVKGVGHGFGMSQFAANRLALEGQSCQAILSYFFQNIVIDKYE